MTWTSSIRHSLVPAESSQRAKRLAYLLITWLRVHGNSDFWSCPCQIFQQLSVRIVGHRRALFLLQNDINYVPPTVTLFNAPLHSLGQPGFGEQGSSKFRDGSPFFSNGPAYQKAGPSCDVKTMAEQACARAGVWYRHLFWWRRVSSHLRESLYRRLAPLADETTCLSISNRFPRLLLRPSTCRRSRPSNPSRPS